MSLCYGATSPQCLWKSADCTVHSFSDHPLRFFFFLLQLSKAIITTPRCGSVLAMADKGREIVSNDGSTSVQTSQSCLFQQQLRRQEGAPWLALKSLVSLLLVMPCQVFYGRRVSRGSRKGDLKAKQNAWNKKGKKQRCGGRAGGGARWIGMRLAHWQ